MKTDLWNDKKFLQKRISEQIKYLADLHLKSLDNKVNEEIYYKLQESAVFQLKRYETRWKELNEIETYERVADTANFIGWKK